jgi:hypothetical protein
MKKVIWLMAVITILTMIACTQSKESTVSKKQLPEAKQIILNALEKQQQTKGYHFKGTYDLEQTQLKDRGTPITYTFTCLTSGIHQNPDYEKLVVESKYGKTETYQNDKKTAMQNKDKWSFFPTRKSSLSYTDRSDKLFRFLCNYMEDFKSVGAEKLKETDCFIVESLIPDEVLQKIYPNLGETGQIIETKFPVAFCKVWIGQENNLPYKFSFTYTKETEIFLPPEQEPGDEKVSDKNNAFCLRGPRLKTYKSETYKITFMDYDKNVDIEMPEEVKKALESNQSPSAK